MTLVSGSTSKSEAPRRPRKSQPNVLKPYQGGPNGRLRTAILWVAMGVLSLVCLVYGFFYAVTTPFLLTQFMAPVALLGGLVIWALPDMRTAPTRTLEYLFFAFFVMAIAWPNYLAINLPGLPWITSVRLVGFPLAFILLVCVSISEEFRQRTARSLVAAPYLWVFVVGFLAVQGLSVIISDRPMESLNAVLAYQISWTAIFFAACYVFLRPGSVEKWVWILWGVVILTCLLGFWEKKIGHVPWAGHVPSFLAVGDEFVQRVLAGGTRFGKYRVQSVQSTSLGFAEFLALASPFLIHFVMSNYKPAVRVGAAGTLAFMFYTILATDSRLGMVGFFLACLLYAFGWSVMRWRNVKGSLVGPAIVLAYPLFAVAFVAATFFVGRLRGMVWGDGSTSYSDRARIDQVTQGIPKILSHPWGYGASRGGEELGYTNLAGTLTIDNYYLLVALDYGVLGFIFYYGAILVAIYGCVRYGFVASPKTREHALLIPIGIALSVFFVIKAIFSQTHNHTLQFMLMGMVCAMIFRILNGDEAGLKPTSKAAGR